MFEGKITLDYQSLDHVQLEYLVEAKQNFMTERDKVMAEQMKKIEKENNKGNKDNNELWADLNQNRAIKNLMETSHKQAISDLNKGG